MKKKIFNFMLALSLAVTGFISFETVDIRAVENVEVVKAVEVMSVKATEAIEKNAAKDDELILDTVIKESIEEEVVKEIPIEERIQRAAEHYHVPFDMVLAIARLETGWFKSSAYVNKNNVGGMMYRDSSTGTYKLMSFDTIEDGVEAFVRNLSKNYFGQGLDTVEEIGRKYCPDGYDHWVKLVKELMTYEV